MGKIKYISGQRYNGFLFLYHTSKGKAEYECPYCKRVFEAYISNTMRPNTIGCGCQKYKNINIKHGEAKMGEQSPEYKAWVGMKARCYYKDSGKTQHYGERGIIVCERWFESFENFLADMGRKPKGLTLERKDNDGIYEKDNCIWDTKKAQVRNRRVTKYLTYNGVAKPLSQWCEELGVAYSQAWRRYKKGRTPEEVLLIKPQPKKSNFIPYAFGYIN